MGWKYTDIDIDNPIHIMYHGIYIDMYRGKYIRIV